MYNIDMIIEIKIIVYNAIWKCFNYSNKPYLILLLDSKGYSTHGKLLFLLNLMKNFILYKINHNVSINYLINKSIGNENCIDAPNKNSVQFYSIWNE